MLSRPLDSNEKLLFLCDRISPFNMVFVLSIDGYVALDVYKRAIDQVQGLHPMLQVKIKPTASGVTEFVSDISLKIPLISVRDEISKVATYVESELMSRFDTSAGPLIRFILIQHEENLSTLLITAHHSIGDGLSGCILARDFLGFLAAGKSTKINRLLPDSIKQRLPPYLCGLRGLVRHARELIRTVKSSVKYGAPAPLAVVDTDLSTRTPMVVFRAADASQVKRILSSCKAHGCSMQGALGAALLLALKNNIVEHRSRLANPIKFNRRIVKNKSNKRSITLQLLSPVNIRKKLIPIIEEEFGLYVATQATNHRLTEKKTFWELALEISLELRSNIDADAAMAFMPIASRYLSEIMALGNKIFGGIRFSRWFCSTFPSCVALSNLGSIDVPSDYGDIRLRGMGFLGSLSAMGSISSFALTFCEQLSWNFVAMAPSLDREHLEAVADESMKYLLEHTS